MSKQAEKYIVLLLGARDEPMPSLWHLQKEMFMLSQAVPKVNEFFDFEKHHNGPFSPILQEIVAEPLYYDGAYEINQNKISLTKKGRDLFEEILTEHQDNTRFTDLLKTIRLTRKVYDQLGKDELLFLVYQTYPEYVNASNIYDRLTTNREERIKLADSLLAKGLITDERYSEIKEIEQ